ncbi:bifunctional 2-C-methyl-D-erythritol 4-phosphate cytidylyltransferase/2-C-methyl-D-erythritol 2,4-cyclodiphosphate synthase [Woodsholea maritima]|uniref:bifunctional 2-C-methyl-D-erythritol 4-phosphate cytidylyltransferase/2-C-methyl-D-erythritol 2,4-cyclodiphosphate synthase n=1 Tax=Woodsholea maritima TaxID=240237 RepID=UPI00037E5960|nr:bifunctional 2-C-methyl-D-erythritol 4-phosphate cytidylyltransferase/2-C-methyl-D-erythritol 2,4-cyclodiphosphate synthase [Woodsholea maritima]
MSYSAIIVAAGRGLRAGGDLPKQYQELAGKPLIRYSVEAFAEDRNCAQIIVVITPDDEAVMTGALGPFAKLCTLVEGGAVRSASVKAGVMAADKDYVLIHDAARPFIDQSLFTRLTTALENFDGVAPTLPVVDALSRMDEGYQPISREGLFRVQTPQAFRTHALKAAFAKAGDGLNFPDEMSLAEAQGLSLTTVEGEENAFKITHPSDFTRALQILGYKPEDKGRTFVVGQGYDVHRLTQGQGVTLCGVWIECPYHLVGHSDADAGLHALTDAILGTCARGDIGQHFPPTDERWKGADSAAFLIHAVELARLAGVRLTHADITLICERPKIGPHRAAMQARVAQLTGLSLDHINIKATTTEKLGFTGRQEGLAAQAIVSGIKS